MHDRFLRMLSHQETSVIVLNGQPFEYPSSCLGYHRSGDLVHFLPFLLRQLFLDQCDFRELILVIAMGGGLAEQRATDPVADKENLGRRSPLLAVCLFGDDDALCISLLHLAKVDQLRDLLQRNRDCG